VRLGDEAQGLPAFARWRAGHPDDEEAAIMHARATFFAGDPATAFARFDSVVTRSPGSREAVLGRATTLRALGRNGDAGTAYEAWLRRVPGDLDASIGRAASLAGSGQTDAALAAFDSLVVGVPDSRDVVLGRASILRRVGRREDARAALGAWVAAHGDDVAAVSDYAEVLLTLGATDSAEVQYRALLAIDSTSFVPRLGLIRLAVRRGNAVAALAAAETLSRAEPRRTEIQVTRADLLLRVGRAREALTVFDSILVTEPTYRDAVLGRGTALARAAGPALSDMYARTQQFAPSIRVFDGWLADHADDDDARLSRAVVLAWAGDLGRARPEFERLLNSPLAREARKYLARISMWRGELERSEAEWRALVRDLPADPDPLVGLGMSLRWQDRPGAAEPYLRKAAAMPSAPPEAAEQVQLVNTDLSLTTLTRATTATDNEGNSLRVAQGQVGFHAPWQGRVELRKAWIQSLARGIAGDARSFGASATWAPPAVPFSLRADLSAHEYAVPTASGGRVAGYAPGAVIRLVAAPTRTVRLGLSGSTSRLTETVRMLSYGSTSDAAGMDVSVATIPGAFLVATHTWTRVHGDSGRVSGTVSTAGIQYTLFRRVAFSADWKATRNTRGGGSAGVWAPRRHDIAELGMLLRPAELSGWSWAWDVAGGWQWTADWDSAATGRQYGKADVTLRYRWASRAEVAITAKATNSAASPQISSRTAGYRGGSVSLEVIRPLIRVRR
jgi:Flp pilus assembly protein TadD